jgi:hypothetical protein
VAATGLILILLFCTDKLAMPTLGVHSWHTRSICRTAVHIADAIRAIINMMQLCGIKEGRINQQLLGTPPGTEILIEQLKWKQL